MGETVLELPREQLGLLYPYYLLLSADEHIVGMGPRLQTILPADVLGAPVFQWFIVAEPRDFSFASIVPKCPVTIMLTSSALPLPLKGTVLSLPNTNQYVFLGTLWVREIEELAKVGLTLKDIPQHDSTLDHLLALQAYRTAFAEVRTLTEKLTAEKAQLREANRRLKTSEEKYRSVVENVKEVIFQTDGEGHWTFVNRAWEEITGFPRLETLGHRIEAFLHPQDRESYQKLLSPLLNGEQTDCRGELRFLTRSGGIRWIEMLARLSHNDNDEPTGISGTLFDITERKQAENELKALTTELQRSNRELSDFAAVASHDLNEPLRKIIIFADRLKSDTKAGVYDNVPGYVERMVVSAARMQALIQGLLEYSRVTSRARPFQPIDLNQLLADVLSDLETAVQRRAAQIQADTLPTVQADPLQMRQLFQNMIGNALKFQAPDVQPILHIRSTLLTEGERDVVVLQFADNGIGFDNQFREKIFEVFERLHSTAEYAGTGMGLAICRKIVERHHGWIRADSRPGEGAEFTVALPLVQAE